jgi:hypothetical protein
MCLCGRSLVWLGHQPPTQVNIDWSQYRQYLQSKYARQYASLLYSYAVRYSECLQNPSKMVTLPSTIQQNVLKGMVALSKFLGCHEEFTKAFKNHGIKWIQGDGLSAFIRIFNNNHSNLKEWYNSALAVLNDNEKLYLRYILLSGIRKEEGIKSFNLMVSLGKRFNEEYYNESTGFLEHFRYPKLFLRNSKNLYVSAVPRTLLTEIATSDRVSYSMIRKRLLKNGLRLRIKELRSFYATNMRELGPLSEQIDLAQGRIGKSIFLQHYFKQNPRALSDKILSLLPKLETLLS